MHKTQKKYTGATVGLLCRDYEVSIVGSLFDTIFEVVTNFIDTIGYAGIFLAMFIEGILTPIPSEIIVPFAGYLAESGRFNLILVILVASVGATVGAIVAYYLAKWLGRAVILRYGKYIGLNDKSLDKANAWFEKYGSYGVLIGHALPGIRSIISFPAGLANMDLKKFITFTFIGAMIWNTVLGSAGYILGENYGQIEELFEAAHIDVIILGALVAILAIYFIYKHYKKVKSDVSKK